jgi:putative transposase
LARAHRHFLSGQIYHITHRCHKREFLLKYAKDRHRWLQWLFEAKKRYGLVILNYTVTSNHIHLLVYDTSDKEVIPRSMQLVAGRTGQEYNSRKKRKGAFWEDRYHATIIECGDHLLRCIVYIDMNMVRAGVVEHPDQWTHGGYREVQSPRRKCILIDYDRLKTLCGFDDFKSFQVAHRRWVKTAIVKNVRHRESAWTRAVAVGSQSFVAKIKNQLNALAIGRRVLPATDFWELREDAIPYNPFIGGPEVEIGTDNTYLWNESDGREYF